MPYEYLEDEAIADIAFKAKAKTLNELFLLAAHAVYSLQTNIDQLDGAIESVFDINAKTLESLLYKFLDEIIYLKDADLFFPKQTEIEVSHDKNGFSARGKFIGSEFNYEIHQMGNDIKAITYHDFKLEKIDEDWECYVLIDI